jgi:hypothetical protein
MIASPACERTSDVMARGGIVKTAEASDRK